MVSSFIYICTSSAWLLDGKLLDSIQKFNRLKFPTQHLNPPVVVGIDQKFLDQIDEPLALSHRYISEFLQATQIGQAKSVGIDLVLPTKRYENIYSKSSIDNDYHQTLIAGILSTVSSTPLVVAKAWDKQREAFANIHIDYKAALMSQFGEFEPEASALFKKDLDGVIRTYPGASIQPSEKDQTFSSEILVASGHSRSDNQGLIDFQKGPSFNYLPISDVLKAHEQGDSENLKVWFDGKIVLLGNVLDDEDLLRTPVSIAAWKKDSNDMPGVLLHAQILSNLEGDGLIQTLSSTWLMFIVLILNLTYFIQSRPAKILYVSLFVIALFIFQTISLKNQFWFHAGSIILVLTWITTVRGTVDAWTQALERRLLKNAFLGSVSPSVMNEIMTGRVSNTSQGRLEHVCILFSDIRGFTSICEKSPPSEIVNLLNEYFSRMTRVVHQFDGTVDKFIGDGMMAFFGAPKASMTKEVDAFNAATAMLSELDAFNEERLRLGKIPIQIGIGLHVGEVIVGRVGSSDRHEYTAIGDAVNISSRLEGLSKSLGYSIVLSESVADALGHQKDIVPIGLQQLKGRSGINVYASAPFKDQV